MVGVAEGSGDNSPGLIEVDAFLVDEDALQLDNSQGRMGIVELNGDVMC